MAPKRPSHIEVRGSVALLTTTQGHVCIIDAEDVPLVDGFAWQSSTQGRTTYVVRRYRDGGAIKSEKLHRRLTGAPDDLVVDHADGNGLNNRRPNLRVCTRAENSGNQPSDFRAKSGLAGAYPTLNGTWYAKITEGGVRRHIGTFPTKEAAHQAYLEARQIRSEFLMTR